MQRNKNKNMFYLDVLHISQSEDERLQGNLFSEITIDYYKKISTDLRYVLYSLVHPVWTNGTF